MFMVGVSKEFVLGKRICCGTTMRGATYVTQAPRLYSWIVKPRQRNIVSRTFEFRSAKNLESVAVLVQKCCYQSLVIFGVTRNSRG